MLCTHCNIVVILSTIMDISNCYLVYSVKGREMVSTTTDESHFMAESGIFVACRLVTYDKLCKR